MTSMQRWLKALGSCLRGNDSTVMLAACFSALALAAPDKMDVAGVWTYRIVELHQITQAQIAQRALPR